MRVKDASDTIRRMVIYQISLRVFTQEGTLAAAERFLPDVKATGADMVYLCPFTEADPDETVSFWSDRQQRSNCGNPRNPYRLSDFFRIDPEYGTDEEFLSFVRHAHELGLKVMMDLVYLHAGPSFGKKHPKYVKCDDKGNPLLNGYHFCIIDFSSRELREYLWENMLYFVEKFGIDGYRTDSGGGVPLDFWTEGARRIRKNYPDFVMLDECNVGSRPEDQKETFDINYAQWWQQIALPNIFLCGEPVRTLQLAWKKEHDYAENAMVIRGVEHHDTANDMYCRRMERISSAKCEASYVLNYCMDGVPFLYNGCEYKDCSRHSIFGQKGQFHIDRTTDPAERFAFFQKLADIHRNEKSILYGSTRWLKHDQEDSVAVIVREYGTEKLYCAVNLGSLDLTVHCPGFPADGEILLRRGFEPEFHLKANGYVVIRQKQYNPNYGEITCPH